MNYVVDLTPAGSKRSIQVAVELPSDVVAGQITRSVKNFAALFIASAFLASLFFQLGGAVRRSKGEGSGEGGLAIGTLRREGLNVEGFNTTRQAQIVINQGLRQYNHIRPHQALNQRPPIPETLSRNGT